jgi:PBP1b-binding outer membrane lipoprotein LpoB
MDSRLNSIHRLLLVITLSVLLGSCGGSETSGTSTGTSANTDTTSPVISLSGENPLSVEVDTTFTDPAVDFKIVVA